MRFVDYIKISTEDDDIAKFRSMSIRLVKESTGHKTLLDNLNEVKDYLNEIETIISELNSELRKVYNGNYQFDLCIDEGDSIDILKIKRKQAKVLSLMCHNHNDKFSKIKKNIEISLSSK